MANDRQQVATQERDSPPEKRELTIDQKIAFIGGKLEEKGPQLVGLLDGKVSPDRFREIVVSVLTRKPELLKCSAASVLQSVMEAATDGLVLDGREAALIDYGGVCKYLPMVGGIVKLLHNTGLIRDIQGDVVYKGEPFEYRRGTDPRLDHRPSLGNRGKDEDIVGAYVVIKTVNGGEYARALARNEIDKARAKSRAQKGGPWFDFYSEMAIKTVLKNQSKHLPKELKLPVFDRDNFMYDLNSAVSLPKETRQLTHDPRDDIPIEAEGQQKATAKPQGGNSMPQGAEAAPKAAKAATTQPQAPDADDGRPTPPDDDDFPGDRQTAPREDQPDTVPTLIIKAISNLSEVRNWSGLVDLMTALWERSAWAAIERDGLHRQFYDLVMTTPAFKEGEPTHIVHKRIVKG